MTVVGEVEIEEFQRHGATVLRQLLAPEWIELLADGKSYVQFLNPGDVPEAVFMIDAASATAREFCNLHGLWKG